MLRRSCSDRHCVRWAVDSGARVRRMAISAISQRPQPSSGRCVTAKLAEQ